LVAREFTDDAYISAKSSMYDIILAHKSDLVDVIRMYQPRRNIEAISRGIEEISQVIEEIIRRVEEFEEAEKNCHDQIRVEVIELRKLQQKNFTFIVSLLTSMFLYIIFCK
jgi:hypothetical protein